MLISIPSILRAQFTADLPVRCYVGPHVIAVEGKPRRGFAKVYMLRLAESQDLCLGKLYHYYTPPICMHANPHVENGDSNSPHVAGCAKDSGCKMSLEHCLVFMPVSSRSGWCAEG